MRVLVCGDRNWIDVDRIEDELIATRHESPNDITCIIEGEARGADQFSRLIGNKLGIPVLSFPAQWGRYGRAAGPIRNQQMLDEGKPDMVLAFHSNLAQSRGTADMVRRARKAGIEVRVIEG